jgi:hypothetical protein
MATYNSTGVPSLTTPVMPNFQSVSMPAAKADANPAVKVTQAGDASKLGRK